MNIFVGNEFCIRFSTEGTLSFDKDDINSMGERPSQKSLTRKKLLSKTNFQY